MSLRHCTANLAAKLRAYEASGSDRYRQDIEGILRVSGPGLDMDYVWLAVARLGLAHLWRELRDAVASRAGILRSRNVSIRVGILTVSDRGYSGEYEDQSGPLIREMATGRLGATVELEAVVPDSQLVIQSTLAVWCDEVGLDLILTTGGTGFAPRDVTPEATRAVIQRETPGLTEAMRAASLKVTPHAMLSRAVAGIRGRTLIVNLPGSPKAVRENLEVILLALPHGIRLLQDVEGENRRHDLQVREV